MISSDAESRAWMEARVKEIVAQIAATDCEEDVLDDAVHDAASEMATEANNGGIEAQVHFLLMQAWKPEDILFRTKKEPIPDEKPSS